MMREVTEFFRPRAETGDARLGRLRSPWAEREGEVVVLSAGFNTWMGSMVGDPLDAGSWDNDGRRKVVRDVDVSMRVLRAST